MSLEIGSNTTISTRNLPIKYSHHSVASTNENHISPQDEGYPARLISFPGGTAHATPLCAKLCCSEYYITIEHQYYGICAMSCYVMLCHAMSCYVMLCHAISMYDIIHYDTEPGWLTTKQTHGTLMDSPRADSMPWGHSHLAMENHHFLIGKPSINGPSIPWRCSITRG